MTEQEIPAELMEFFEPLKAEFISVLAVNTNKYRGAHYATFPLHLVTPCVLATCPPDGLVLDPFCGSGSTGEVALNNDRSFIGVELVEKSAILAQDRLQNC